MKMILPAVALLTVATLLSGIGAARAGQYDGLRQTAVAAVSGAGSAAGLARACGIDPRPIAAAAEQLFRRLQLDRAAQATARAGYRANEARMTASVLANPEASLCKNERLVRDTVRALDSVGIRQSAARPEAGSASLAEA
jgi:hypothetical protein